MAAIDRSRLTHLIALALLHQAAASPLSAAEES